MRHIMFSVLFFLICSCGDNNKSISCSSSLNNFEVEFEIVNRKAIPVNELFSITGFVISKHPIQNFTLELEAIMPEHHHGMNVDPVVNLREDGSFTVDGMLFHMPGKWLLHFYIRHDHLTEVAMYEAIL